MKIFSDHSVDKDICLNSQFISKLDVDAAFEKHYCHVIVSKCGISINPMDWLLWALDIKWGIHGDGVIPLVSQIDDGRIMNVKVLTASHTTSMQKSKKYVMLL